LYFLLAISHYSQGARDAAHLSRRANLNQPTESAMSKQYSPKDAAPAIADSFPPPQLTDTLQLESYDDQYFGFMRLEVTKDEIVGITQHPTRRARRPSPGSRTVLR
jgi:hypothetical protein